MRTTLKVTSKGQITLRKDVLAHLGVRPGDRIVVEFLADGRAEVSAAGPRSLDAFFGCLSEPGTAAVSLEAMNDLITRGWAGER